jgi:hypothetical protein
MKPLTILVVCVGLALTAALGANASTPTTSRVLGHVAITNPNIPVFCPSQSSAQPFTLKAEGSTFHQTAQGSMTADTVDFGSCTPITVTADVTCLLVVGHKAVAFGPVTSISAPTSFFFNFLAIVVQDNGSTGDIGNIVQVFMSVAPSNCAEAGLSDFFAFLGYPFASGGVTIN